ncbi:MAG: hypothetical protein MI702_07180 [Chlorobiales bacterium]|nr:hypothetical protein [Chlorobiales bacterium]
MKQLYIFFLTLGLLVIAVILWPGLLINPGPLSVEHEKLAGGCMSCHTPLFGTPSSKCVSCHTADEIGLKDGSGKDLVEPDSVAALLHRELADSECIACHTEHSLPGKGTLFASMDHSSLVKELQKNCIACHDPDLPDDVLHAKAGSECNACHSTQRWEPAEFDHDRLLLADRGRTGDCSACHDSDRPDDILHKEAKNTCGDCHNTTAWKPADFDHVQWFRFDRDHPAECSTCHDNPLDYKQYTCYGCHEHSKRGVAAEHREEGIKEFSDCVECHRSSNEGEAERLWRKKAGRLYDSD